MQPTEEKNAQWAKRKTKIKTPLEAKSNFLRHRKTSEHINSHIYNNIPSLYPLWFAPIDHTYLSSVSEYNAILSSDNSVKIFLNDEIYNGITSLDESDTFKFKCFCLLSVIYFKSKFKFRKENRFAKEGCSVSLHSKVSESMFGSRDMCKIKKYLEDFGVIEIEHETGMIGKFTKKYRITPKYFKSFFYARLYFPLKMVKNFFNRKRIYGKEIELNEADKKRRDFFLMVSDSLSLSDGYLDCAKNANGDDRPYVERCLDRFQDKRFSAKPDPKTGRWFTWATSCPKNLRRHVLIDGEQTCEIDYGNMQPWLCLTIYSEADFKNPNISAEIEKYREISKTNQFYNFFASKAKVDILPDEKKNEFKERVFKEIFFGPTNDNHQLWRFFCEEFPILSKRIRELKEIDYTQASLKLQSMEAKIVIQGVLDKLIDTGVKCLTIHDSILCKESDRAEIHKIMNDEFRFIMGDNPILKMK